MAEDDNNTAKPQVKTARPRKRKDPKAPGRESEIMYLKGVGPRRAELLGSELGVYTAQDILHVFPFRYIDRSSFTPIRDICSTQALVQIRASVVSIVLHTASGENILVTPQAPRKPEDIHFNLVKRMCVVVSDESGSIELVFFKGVKWTYTTLAKGGNFIFFGKPSVFGDRFNFVHPEIDYAAPSIAGTPAQKDGLFLQQGRLEGVYPSTEKLRSSGITAKVFAKIVASAWEQACNSLEDPLPKYMRDELELVDLRTAIHDIHFPATLTHAERAAYRLKFEELFYLQLSLLKQKYVNTRTSRGIILPKVGDDFNACFNALPYELTGAQKRVVKEIRTDFMSGHQMNRLLQGDVGSGKTMVALLSCLLATGSGYQACLMAPTEVLARQHFASLSRYLGPTKVKIAILTGTTSRKEREEIHTGIEDGSIGILVGTHALLEDNVQFKKLALAVIDEQHRFGVEQRSKLWAKGSGGMPPHILVMTATPIPRTLAMTLYGDLDVSILDEMPPGRKRVQTIHTTEAKRVQLHNFMKQEIARGRQVFVVYPIIYESQTLDLKTLEEGYDLMTQVFPFPDYHVTIVHGQMSSEDKNANMQAFSEGRADILVSTSVIEVGVDVPNASVMVIESAERFGLSQLHQLRGRVGRGSEKSYCVLMTGYKLTTDAKKKIEIMVRTEDGFEIAEEDMRLRGPGEMDGTRQTGLPVELKIASLGRDGDILARAKNYASKILEKDPLLESPQNWSLARELSRDCYSKLHNFSKIS